MQLPAVFPGGRKSDPGAGRFLAGLLFAAALPAQAAEDLTGLSLEALLQHTVVGASKYEQKQYEVAAAVSVITRQEIQAFGWRTLAEALASLPGVHTTYDHQYDFLGMRGFGLPGDLTARVLVTINGNRVNDPVYDGGPVGRDFPLDMNLVERVEFIPGPGGAVYGQNAMFGVVNVVTRTGAGVDGIELTAAYQHPQADREGRASWGERFDNGVDLLLSATGMRAQGDDHYFDYGSSGISGVAAGMDGERDQEVFLRVARGPWAGDLVHGNRDKEDPTAAYFGDPLVQTPPFSDSYSQAQVQYQRDFAEDTLQLTGRVFAGRYRFQGTLSYGTLFGFPAEGDWRGTEWRVVSTAVAGHTIMAGLEAQHNVRTDQAALDLADPANDVEIRQSGYRVGVFAHDEWRVGRDLTSTLGLRIDHNDATGTQLSPRAALIWRAAPVTTLKWLVGRAHRAPNVYEKDYGDGLSQVGNPELNGEYIDTMEVVADHQVGQTLALRASVYWWTMHDIVTLGIDPASGLTQYQSGETVRARGLELSADRTWNSGARLRGSVSLQDVAYASGADLPNSPELLAKLNLSGPLPWAGLRVGFELQYSSQRLSLDGTRLGGYAHSNLFMSTAALAKGLTLSLGVRNLFDKHYAHPGAESNWQNSLQQDGRGARVWLDYAF